MNKRRIRLFLIIVFILVRNLIDFQDQARNNQLSWHTYCNDQYFIPKQIDTF